jgi:hypothetical protein
MVDHVLEHTAIQMVDHVLEHINYLLLLELVQIELMGNLWMFRLQKILVLHGGQPLGELASLDIIVLITRAVL